MSTEPAGAGEELRFTRLAPPGSRTSTPSPARPLLFRSPVLGIANIAWQTVGSELAALGTAALAAPLRWLVVDPEFDATARHPTPVVFVHGFLGDPTNFLALRTHLGARGVRNCASFSYRPRLDYQRLAGELGRMIDGVCRATGCRQVDVVGHSLGGLIARYLTESTGRPLVRRLVTLGAPYYAGDLPKQELAIFGAHDPLIAAPDPVLGPHGRVRVVPDAGHLGLLYHPAVLRAVVRHLTEPLRTMCPIPTEDSEAA